MSVPTYERYRDSGVEWLGPVPVAWPVSPLGYRYDVALGKMLDEKQITGTRLAPYLRNVDVQWDRINVENLPEMDFSSDEVERYGLRTGDLLVCEGGEVGRAAIWTAQVGGCFYQKALHRLRPRDARQDHPRFLFYVLRAATNQQVFTAGSGKATIAHLPAEAFRRFRFPFPSGPEQAAIAAFLDLETSKIDALVEAQTRLIELLKEKRQAVISHAVTKGLDPAAPLKESGVEWLGQVPAHWEVKKLGSICSKIGSGKTPSGGAETYVEAGIAFLRSQNVYDDGLWLDELVYIPEAVDEEMSNTRVQPGDVLLNITGASLGRTCIVPEPFERANVNQHVCILRLRDVAQRGFVSMAMKSISTKGQIDATQNGAAREGLNFQQIAALRVALPPENEASEIAKVVYAQVGRLDRLSEQAEAAVALLQERRAALISAAVTGKIDVRAVGAVQSERGAA